MGAPKGVGTYESRAWRASRFQINQINPAQSNATGVAFTCIHGRDPMNAKPIRRGEQAGRAARNRQGAKRTKTRSWRQLELCFE
jgi:hypothetical protein